MEVVRLFGEHLPLLHQLALLGQQLAHLLGAAPTVAVQLLQPAGHTHTQASVDHVCEQVSSEGRRPRQDRRSVLNL